MMTSAESAPRLFALFSLSDPTAPELLDSISETFSVSTRFDTSGELHPAWAAREGIQIADVVVAVIPVAGNRDRTNVIFETGIAIGLDRPVLIVAKDAKLPRGLVGLPYFQLNSPASIKEAIRAAMKTGATAYRKPRKPPPDAQTRNSNRKPHVVKPPKSPSSAAMLSEIELLDHVARVLKAAGADVAQREQRLDSPTQPDLVIWDDSLVSTFGLPLPVEVLRRASSSRVGRGRLLNTLASSGAKSLLAVAASGLRNHRWTNGTELILTITVESLEKELRHQPLAAALNTLLSEADT